MGGLRSLPAALRPRRHRALHAFAAAVWLAAAAAAAGAPEAPAEDAPSTGELAGRTVTALAVEGARSLAEETVLHHLGLEIGAPYDPAELDRRLRELWERGLLEDLAIDGRPHEGGVGVVVRIVERPTVAALDYRGLQRVRQEEIAERLAAGGIGVVVGEPLRRGELPRLEAAIEALCRERGLPEVDAVAAAEERPGGTVAVVVTVDEGDRLRVAELVFEGNAALSDARLRRTVEESRPTGWLVRLRGKDRFDRAALERDLARVRELYRRAGYKDAALGEPRVEIVERGSGREVRITVPVEEGERWRLGGVGFTGNREISDERLLALFDRPASGWLGSGYVDEGVERVRDLYAEGGFLTARVEPSLVERGERTADVIVRIDEGERYRVGRIEIEGNTETLDKVIRRELAVQEGRILDARALRRSLLRLGQLDVFELDEEEPVRFSIDEDERRVDLILRGREADPPRLFFGGGYGVTHGLFGDLRYTSRNFRGRGETLAASLQAGPDLTRVELGYRVPWLLDRRQSLGGEVFLTEESLDAGGGERLLRDLSGLRLTWGRRLGLFQSLDLTYGWQDVLDSRSRTTAAGDAAFRSIDREVSTLKLGYLLDRIDDRYRPTRGLRLSGSLEAAGGALGGDARYLRSRLGLAALQPLGGRRPRAVAGFNLEVGRIRPLGGAELAFNDRLFRGGDGSLRGFDALSIHPRGEDGAPLVDGDGFLLGGDRYLEAALELHLPLGEALRLVLFTDAGNVWAEGQTVDLGSLRHSAGLELRVTTPLFPEPLRFIFSDNLSPLPGERFDRFQFSLGARF